MLLKFKWSTLNSNWKYWNLLEISSRIIFCFSYFDVEVKFLEMNDWKYFKVYMLLLHIKKKPFLIYSLSSAEESDRMLEPDPRIVLRPMGRVEDA